MRKAEEDPNLAEVKAVLRKLQRLDLDADRLEDQARVTPPPAFPGAGAALAPAAETNLGVFDKKRAAIAARGKAARSPLAPLIAVFAGVALVAAGGLFAAGVFSPRQKEVSAPNKGGIAPTEGHANTDILTEARRLLGRGEVSSARNMLLGGDPGQHAGLAFTLAQTYDPNYLRTLPAPDSPANLKEAERWYRAWYELAVKSGLDMDAERLKRIINAMQ